VEGNGVLEDRCQDRPSKRHLSSKKNKRDQQSPHRQDGTGDLGEKAMLPFENPDVGGSATREGRGHSFGSLFIRVLDILHICFIDSIDGLSTAHAYADSRHSTPNCELTKNLVA
jgi:hypothetical protein